MLRAGLESAAWIGVDDTGARHKAINGFCTPSANIFAWFGTTRPKSRLNFLEMLRADHTDYVVNAAALAYMGARALAGPVVRRLRGMQSPFCRSGQPGRRISSSRHHRPAGHVPTRS